MNKRDKLGRYVKGHKGLSGSENGMWLGDKVTYAAAHIWIKKLFGSADHCDKCDKKGPYISNGKAGKYEWSMKTKKLTRKREDWWQLCVKCHRKFDNHIFFRLNHRGENNHFAKLNGAQVKEIKELHKIGVKNVDIMKKFCISNLTVWRIVTNRSWV